ncbi:hypothetical protein FOA43_002419 [Brettanomyces nanus]|uniref:Kinetochore protein mis13 n=1 Tax=Eeniella nana TaxID=13502 RepID=A0A875S5Q0_EENNA|nr:uncharacterized protein FOA43_002419 [Brettanomyces nanus]QPG75079.1 hypothetical protein FOA43_002419 [Brettanomyces nanus]
MEITKLIKKGRKRGRPRKDGVKRPDESVGQSLLDVLEYDEAEDVESEEDSWFSSDEVEPGSGGALGGASEASEALNETLGTFEALDEMPEASEALGERLETFDATPEASEALGEALDTTPETFEALGEAPGELFAPEKLVDPIIDITSKQPLKLSVEEQPSRRYSRRSSLSNRGKRLSSIGNGFIAEPHSEVPIEEFYKHFDRDLPDPQKMRQLLIWCCRRIDFGVSKKDPQLVDVARKVKETFTKNLMEGKMDISWWKTRQGQDKSHLPIRMRPNETNIRNLNTLKVYRRKLDRLNGEQVEWSKVTSKKPERIEQIYEKATNIDDKRLDRLQTQIDMIDDSYKDKKKLRMRLVGLMEDMKYNVHKMKQTDQCLKSLIEDKMKVLNGELGKSSGDSIELLKVLSRL